MSDLKWLVDNADRIGSWALVLIFLGLLLYGIYKSDMIVPPNVYRKVVASNDKLTANAEEAIKELNEQRVANGKHEVIIEFSEKAIARLESDIAKKDLEMAGLRQDLQREREESSRLRSELQWSSSQRKRST